ncbi:oligosaccharide flippase family protein [Exiguobacterium antarcticum]|uniref:Oligosaccharide flippase family protein n=1 Tax=Exiguobacterium antarcticum TaxID=132920 RepID=A0ABT6R5P3_9BACL|nr:polysaccharide biosynthesis C-terminal domain-containing protein [Exiguobacterium antarcticum]MDI3236271.1 oligosaccharide flippase family protein [Exiguobacterium antarcticum]
MSKQNSFLKKLLSNTFLFAIGSFSTRILIFLLVPLYARTLETKEYGVIDLITVTVSLLLPIFGLNIHEAVLRFLLSKKEDSKIILGIGFQVTIIGFIIVCLFSPLILGFLNLGSYYGFFVLSYLITSLKNLLLYYARGLEKIKLIIKLSILDTIMLLGCNLILLYVYRLGIEGYYISLLVSGTIITILYTISLKIDLTYFFKRKDSNIRKNMFKYSLPMVPNSLSWWVSNTSDKYILNYFSGVSTTGLYSMAYKVPSLLNTITSIFMQAWQISSVEEFENGRTESFSKVYKTLFSINILVCSALIIFAKPISSIMFGETFKEAFYFVPILLVAYFFNGLASYLGTIYTSAMVTSFLFYSTAYGGILNIILNIYLIPNYGAYGASFATLSSYMLIWIVRLYNSKKIVKISWNKLIDSVQIVILICLALLVSFSSISRYIYLFVYLLLLFLNKKMFIDFYNLFSKLLSKKRNR